MGKPVALVTGISGQDGFYLSDLLEQKGYEVHGVDPAARASLSYPKYHIHYADFADGSNLGPMLDEVKPDEVYHLAAQSHVRLSFDIPVYTADVTGLGTLRILEAIRLHQQRLDRQVRFYQASSSEMFGEVTESPQTETTLFRPRSPYACAKVFAHYQTLNYRDAYKMFAVSGILFNHESPRRGDGFVTRKITKAAARIKLGLQDKLTLGNLDARRDWGFAGDYVDAMWRMLQAETPDDFVIATGETHSVRDFLDAAFGCVELDWNEFVEIDERFLRPTEVELLCGDATKAREQLGWEPKVSFNELVKLMVEADLEAI